jgi:acyl-ACP thioesterase
MKVSVRKKIDYFETDRNFTLRLASIFRMLQEAALRHSEKAGYPMEAMGNRGFAWILNKMRVEIFRYPRYGENTETVTWSREVSGFRAFRDFEMFTEKDKAVSASSTWAYLDLDKKRIKRVPDDVKEKYTVEETEALDFNIEEWKIPRRTETLIQEIITTRYSDFDTNGHVNNTVYIDYLEHLISKLEEGKE